MIYLKPQHYSHDDFYIKATKTTLTKLLFVVLRALIFGKAKVQLTPADGECFDFIVAASDKKSIGQSTPIYLDYLDFLP